MKEIVAKLQELVKNDFSEGKIQDIDMWVAAHNRFQENWRDGVDYLFNYDKAEDLICCINGGMTAKDIAKVVHTTFWGKSKGTDYFLFGQNYPSAKRLDREALLNLIYAYVEEIIEDMLKYPHIEEYTPLYQLYVVSNIK